MNPIGMGPESKVASLMVISTRNSPKMLSASDGSFFCRINNMKGAHVLPSNVTDKQMHCQWSNEFHCNVNVNDES